MTSSSQPWKWLRAGICWNPTSVNGVPWYRSAGVSQPSTPLSRWSGRPAVLSGQEEKAGALLVVVAPNPAAWIRSGRLVRLWHATNREPGVPYLSGNLN
jgi:hypothetical protein